MKIAFLGSSSVLTRLARFIAEKDEYDEVYIGYSPRHAKAKGLSGRTYEEDLFALQKMYGKIRLFKFASLDENSFEQLCSSDLQISIGSPWIFKRKHLDMAPFLIHTHCTDLPRYRGGASASWMIMNEDRKSAVVIYKMNEGIDSGELIEKNQFYFPAGLRTPEEYTNYVHDKLVEALKVFINSFKSNCGYYGELRRQDEGFSTYFPRLSAAVNAWINWSWDPREIVSFINAFSDPYQGAMTRCTSNPDLVLCIKKAELIQDCQMFHPFMNGLIYRKNSDKLYVACGKGALMISEYSYNQNEPKPKKITLGDRMYTLSQDAEAALATRVRFNPE